MKQLHTFPTPTKKTHNIILVSIILNTKKKTKNFKCLKQGRENNKKKTLPRLSIYTVVFSNIIQTISFADTTSMYKIMIKFAYYKMAWLCSVNNIPLQFTAKYPQQWQKKSYGKYILWKNCSEIYFFLAFAFARGCSWLDIFFSLLNNNLCNITI